MAVQHPDAALKKTHALKATAQYVSVGPFVLHKGIWGVGGTRVLTLSHVFVWLMLLYFRGVPINLDAVPLLHHRFRQGIAVFGMRTVNLATWPSFPHPRAEASPALRAHGSGAAARAWGIHKGERPEIEGKAMFCVWGGGGGAGLIFETEPQSFGGEPEKTPEWARLQRP